MNTDNESIIFKIGDESVEVKKKDFLELKPVKQSFFETENYIVEVTDCVLPEGKNG